MRRRILFLALLATAPPVAAQPRTPERLLIGPPEYLRAPKPFPMALGPTSSDVDSILARNLAPRNWGMAKALPCRAVPLADTTGWRISANVVLPAGFAADSSFRSYHGGLKWKSGDLALVVENGWWSVDYDSAGHLLSCRVTARAGEYIVSESRTPEGFEFRAFPWNPQWGPSTAIGGAAKTEEGLRILWTSFMTMVPPHCRYMTGDPIRNPSGPPC
ncbi:MAG TPA: hypothetical protein VFO55_13695 [Gemmatimonadaceae bacterium]|nr:hypothetical protein [Gemmatimonadaceae bacterium]